MKKIINLSLAAFLLIFTLTPFNGLIISAEEPSTYKINVRAESTNEKIAGVTFDATGPGYTQTATSTATADSIFTGLSAGDYTIKITIPDSVEYELLSGTSQRTVTLSETNQEETIIFELKKKEASVDENMKKIAALKLPASLTKVGSTTTDISKLTAAQLKTVKNFTFDNPGVNKIVYTKTLDLSKYSEYENIETISDYLDLETAGKVKFDIDSLTKFNTNAKITMSKIKLVDFIDENGDKAKEIAVINKDGELAKDITNLKYEGDKLSFDVNGFSTYTLIPRLSTELENLTKVKDSIAGNLKYEVSTEEVNLVVNTDNLDASITVTNNGDIVNFPDNPNSEGQAKNAVKLKPGDNKFKIKVALPNGESTTQIISVKYTAQSTNDASSIFKTAAIILILCGIIGAGGYYYYRSHKIKKNLSKNEPEEKKEPISDQTTPINQQEETEEKYEERLLTEEEKEMYKVKKTEKPSSEVVETTETVDENEIDTDTEGVDKSPENSNKNKPKED